MSIRLDLRSSTMAVNGNKHCEEFAERRLALFGDQPAKVTLDDIFDVEAPELGAGRDDRRPTSSRNEAMRRTRRHVAPGRTRSAASWASSPRRGPGGPESLTVLGR